MSEYLIKVDIYNYLIFVEIGLQLTHLTSRLISV